MRVLAFDLGTTYGWAYLNLDGNEAVTGTVDLSKLVDRPAKLTRLFYNTVDMIAEYLPDVVAYERPHLRGWPATAMLVGMMGVVEVAANTAEQTDRIRVVSASTGEIKRFATAKWNASKEEVLAQMKLRFGDRLGWTTRPRQEPTEHEADAAALALFVEQGGGK